MQKLIGKIPCLGKGASWIFKLMSHIYTSLAFALHYNKALLEALSDKFKTFILQIKESILLVTKLIFQSKSTLRSKWRISL
jgi:hypothetical protein